jgi:hypothetical protein
MECEAQVEDSMELTLAGRQEAYRRAIEDWVVAVRAEEALISPDSSLTQIDTWGGAHFRQENAYREVKRARKEYYAALRKAAASSDNGGERRSDSRLRKPAPLRPLGGAADRQ